MENKEPSRDTKSSRSIDNKKAKWSFGHLTAKDQILNC